MYHHVSFHLFFHLILCVTISITLLTERNEITVTEVFFTKFKLSANTSNRTHWRLNSTRPPHFHSSRDRTFLCTRETHNRLNRTAFGSRGEGQR